jgi:hypothetical protein
MATNAAPLSRTTPWSAAGVPQSKTPTPQNAAHRRAIPDSDRIVRRHQRWTTEWSTQASGGYRLSVADGGRKAKPLSVAEVSVGA